jgi:hypothetical protein
VADGGHDILNSRTQPEESIIGPRNAARLAQKWNFTTPRTGGAGNNKFYAFSIDGR